MKKIKKLTGIYVKGLEAEIALQGTSVRFCFCAGMKEFNEAEEEWRRLGNLIEEEKGAIFFYDHYVKEIYLIEIIFSDEGTKAKSMAVSYNPREAEEAKKWFWWKLTPIFIFSLFVVHWTLLGIALAVAYFLHKSVVDSEKRNVNMPEKGREQLIEEYRKLRIEQEAA